MRYSGKREGVAWSKEASGPACAWPRESLDRDAGKEFCEDGDPLKPRARLGCITCSRQGRPGDPGIEPGAGKRLIADKKPHQS